MKKSLADIRAIVARIKFLDRVFDVLEKGDGFLLQISYMEPDIDTGKPSLQKSRKWYVSPWMTETEIVEAAFACCQRSMLHITGEHFTYQGLRVYSPHFQIRARVEMANRCAFDKRPDER